MLKGSVYKSYVRQAMQYGSIVPRENYLGILERTGKSMVWAMCGVQLKDR